MITENFPTWALPYAVNGDIGDLTESEINQITESLQGLELLSWGENEFFHQSPMFGLACMCVEVTFKIVE